MKDEGVEREKIQSRLSRIRHKIIVLSGKGGVGKSTVAVNLATAAAVAGYAVGLLDIDIHGPSVPTMLGLETPSLTGREGEIHPVRLGSLKVMSLGFLLQNPDDAVIWRGPLKMGVIRQFLSDVDWGDLDYLIIDAPPGTGDEPLSLCQLIQPLDGAVIVTTPQRVAAVDVRKCVSFCRRLSVPVLGVIENMSGFVCPKCGEITRIFPGEGGREIAADKKVPYLGSIPIDPTVAEAGDKGKVFVYHYGATATGKIMQGILAALFGDEKDKKD
ncbi:MAG TPA: Mrp/NBP35 family ATP-binding protein [Syntrophales bacterium]|nr:Mrp/NBP35 family ATP-binding protein [Syntrophales bacterium]